MLRFLLIFLLAIEALGQPFRSFLAWDSQVQPILEDTFSTDRAAGSINNTPADGRTSTILRTVVDTENKLSISGGKLVFAGGKAVDGDPAIRYPAVTRQAGRCMMWDASITGINYAWWGFDNNASAGAYEGIRFSSTFGVIENDTSGPTVAANPVGSHSYAYILRAFGGFVLMDGKLLWVASTGSVSPLYPAFCNYASSYTIDNLRIPRTLYIPSPVASDSFNRTSLGSTDGAGHAEANSGSGLAWRTGANNTWNISGGKLVNSPTVGSDIFGGKGDFSDVNYFNKDTSWTFNGTAAVKSGTGVGSVYKSGSSIGMWYLNRFTISGLSGGNINLAGSVYLPGYSISSSGSKTVITRSVSSNVGITGDPATVATLDDWILSPIPTPDLFCTVNCGTPDVLLDVTINGTSLGSSGTQAGVVLNLDDPSNPQNFVIIYFDGVGNIRAEKCIGGTYTSISSTAVTYSAGKVLRVMHDKVIGEYRVFYGNVAVGPVITAFTDDAYKNNTYHGTFSTSSNAQFSPVTIWARGNEGQYSQLDTIK